MAKKQVHPLDDARDAALATIKQIADRAVHVYAQYDTRIDRMTIVMDLTACHFSGQKLRLDDLLAADAVDFVHDISGINRHLNHKTYELTNGFSPRFSLRAAVAA